MFPVAPFNVTMWPPGVTPSVSNAEIARCTAIAGDVLTIVRAQEGTTAQSIAVGYLVGQNVTAGLLLQLTPSIVSPGNLGASQTVAVATNALTWLVGMMNANLALTLTLGAGSSFKLLATQDGTGNRTLTVNGTLVTINPVAGAVFEVDIFSPDGTALYVDVAAAAGPQGIQGPVGATGNTGPQGPTGSAAGTYGPGTDGVATLDGTATVAWATLAGSTYTMSRDCWCGTLTVNSGVTLVTNGWRVFVAGTFTINSGGIVGIAGGSAAGTVAGAANAQNILNAGIAGAASAVGAGTASTTSTVGSGGAGGLGSSGAGGVTSTPTLNAAKAPSVLQSPAPGLLPGYFFGGASHVLGGGSNGASGGGDGTNKGGAGGAGGPCIVIFAITFVNNGTIIASGGNGGSPPTGNCGGGGGGSGGLVVVYSKTAATMGTVTITGGTGGTAIGTGVNGSAGTSGFSFNAVLAS